MESGSGGGRLSPSGRQAAAIGWAVALCGVALQSDAQTYPARPVRLVVSVAPGGNLDLMGRAAAQWLTTAFGRQVFVENRPGANSTIGTDNVGRSTPDGHSLVMIAPSFLVAPRMMNNPPFDPVRDFVGLSKIAVLPQMLVVHPSLPPRSVKEFIAFARPRPGQLNCGSSGNGSGSHMAFELFNRQAGVRLARIPYNGDGPALIDLISGQVPVKFDNLSTSIPHVRSGRLRPLGVTSPQRSALMPEVPAIAETLPGFEASIFNGMAAPAATPREIVARIHGELLKFTQSEENKARFAQMGVELQGSPSSEHFSAFIKSEYARLSKVLEEAGITAQ
jgi:tripartite-type tricarboxylate transporter receptor subunit TctC